ncbi:MAG: hypothetical protein WKI04_14820 [Ferruginibacter sp.]
MSTKIRVPSNLTAKAVGYNCQYNLEGRLNVIAGAIKLIGLITTLARHHFPSNITCSNGSVLRRVN